MPKFKKKPVVIDAEQYTEAKRAADQLPPGVHIVPSERGDVPVCHTLEGDLNVSEGDWIIRGVKGEFYPCKPDIFAATYDPVE